MLSNHKALASFRTFEMQFQRWKMYNYAILLHFMKFFVCVKWHFAGKRIYHVLFPRPFL